MKRIVTLSQPFCLGGKLIREIVLRPPHLSVLRAMRECHKPMGFDEFESLRFISHCGHRAQRTIKLLSPSDYAACQQALEVVFVWADAKRQAFDRREAKRREVSKNHER